jgi:hypothetical protein
MPENFADAALRHWHDAQLLEAENRLENADQLYGLSAECAIKKALLPLPGLATQGSLAASFKVHINLLWDRVNYQSVQKRYPHMAAYLKAANPFSGWNIDQRYSANGSIVQKDMECHRIATSRLLGIIGLSGGRRP